MNIQRIAESTGEIDTRHNNGNNGTRRGKDKMPRLRCGFYIHIEETRAGLPARLDALIVYYGGPAASAKALKVSIQTVQGWKVRNMISWQAAEAAHRASRRQGCKGFRAAWLRFALKFDGNGKCLEKRCKIKKFMRVVKKEDIGTTNSIFS
ncbi:transcriptional regulator [Shigella phage vB_SflS-ISF001]|uniref:Uncharacterized protein n=1 Tax=Shigella phage vB_SflS-ISF001 TaxID=2048005 RepID=A0A2D1GQ78_9CAUD|nr:transcriptional regulator [Shigella phage vB_SflS-ISF001]ATN94091.1 hypothetical protein FLXISF001_013 [Shigella phage vB_SflS-ISF001]